MVVSKYLFYFPTRTMGKWSNGDENSFFLWRPFGPSAFPSFPASGGRDWKIPSFISFHYLVFPIQNSVFFHILKGNCCFFNHLIMHIFLVFQSMEFVYNIMCVGKRCKPIIFCTGSSLEVQTEWVSETFQRWPEILQGSLNGTHFAGIKQRKNVG